MTEVPNPKAVPQPTAPKRGNGRYLFVLFLVLIAGIAGWMYWSGIDRESTDDAFLSADVFQINAKVAGRIVDVPVSDNMEVVAGQLLAVVESADYQNRVEQTTAAVALAKAQLQEDQRRVALLLATTAREVDEQHAEVARAEAHLQQANAAMAAATTESERTKAEAQRYQQLTEKAVSRQKLQDVQAAQVAAESALQAAVQSVASMQAEVDAAKAHLALVDAQRAEVDVAKATVDRRVAELQQAEAVQRDAEQQLSYTRITAPVAGRVTKKLVHPGTFVQPGQTLMALVGDEIWVTANFKETQLRRMRVGQTATVRIDAYDLDVEGHVESVQRGSGAAFSLLPPENATGNYVKVVQRVPVKIVLDRQPDPKTYHLGPGMSVLPTVHLR